jgi:hypothetical protein
MPLKFIVFGSLSFPLIFMSYLFCEKITNIFFQFNIKKYKLLFLINGYIITGFIGLMTNMNIHLKKYLINEVKILLK